MELFQAFLFFLLEIPPHNKTIRIVPAVARDTESRSFQADTLSYCAVSGPLDKFLKPSHLLNEDTDISCVLSELVIPK